MKAVIMAGGKGTRLYPLTRHVPKPMVPLLDRPVLEYIVEWLAKHGSRDLLVTTCHLSHLVKEYFGAGERWNVSIRYSDEEQPLGTAGGVKLISSQLQDTFVVVSGDGLSDFDLSYALTAHRRSQAMVTMLLTRVQCPQGYGVVVRDRFDNVIEFVEKPTTWDTRKMYWVNTGMYILEPEILDYVPDGQSYDFGKELFPKLLRQGVTIKGLQMNGYWSDIGTLRQYYQTQLDMIEGRVNVSLPIEIDALEMV
jgi:NDP-sugar pyrophosphorylase family protein